MQDKLGQKWTEKARKGQKGQKRPEKARKGQKTEKDKQAIFRFP